MLGGLILVSTQETIQNEKGGLREEVVQVVATDDPVAYVIDAFHVNTSMYGVACAPTWTDKLVCQTMQNMYLSPSHGEATMHVQLSRRRAML